MWNLIAHHPTRHASMTAHTYTKVSVPIRNIEAGSLTSVPRFFCIVHAPDVERLEVGSFLASSTNGLIEIKARFEARGNGSPIKVYMPSADEETRVAVRRGALAGLWCLETLVKCHGIKDAHLPLPLSQCLQHCTIHISPRFPFLPINGSSVGLATALSMVSLCLGRPPANVPATGRVSFTWMG